MAANDYTVRRDSVNSYTSGPQTPQGALGRYQTQSPHDPAMAFPLQAQLPTPRMSPQMIADYIRRQAISTQPQPPPTTMQAQPPTPEEAQARLNRQFALFGMAYFQRLDPQAKQQFQQLPSQKQNEVVRNAIEQRKQQEIHKAREQQMAAQQAKQQEAQQLAAQQLAAQQLAVQQLAAQQLAARQAHFNRFTQQYVSSFSPEKLQRFRQGSGIQQKQHLCDVYQQMQNAQKLQQQKMQQMQQHQPAGQLQQVLQPQQLAQQPQRILQTPEVQQHRQLQSPRILQAPQARQHQEPQTQRILQAPQAQQHQEPQAQRIQQTQPAPQLKRPRSDDDEPSPATKVAKVTQPITEQQSENTEDPDDQRLRSKLTIWLASNEAKEEAQKSEQSAELHWQMQHAGPYAGPYAGYEPAKSNIPDNSF
ncbi:uncharacterized protein J4E92_000237 [Alternaria infectoria]|uniref:uncharacterized protein n=1 Tax=Alternaria infectoria TaxID=45303 RepID=UPI00221F2CAD|nr:uncharacterized protein J4E92_000237 [Alternaria infectoria]KAI4938956.1 hypothetical protein J4E92_000237 [Alternaria infectoria]